MNDIVVWIFFEGGGPFFCGRLWMISLVVNCEEFLVNVYFFSIKSFAFSSVWIS